MSYQRKLNCPICDFPRLTNLSRHLTTVHGINGQERKCLLAKTRFSVLSAQSDQSQPSTPTQFGNSLPKTSPLPEQKNLPNPIPTNSTSDENEDQLIPCPYDSRISYERIWGTNVPVMDYDIFKLHHPFSMLVAGPRGAGKSEFVKQLLALKRFIMTDPSWTQEIFTVTKIIPRVPPVYRLRDYTDDEIEGVFYAEELQKVQKPDDVYKIEKILAEKKENGKVKVLVKWLGYDKKFNTWIPKSELLKR